MLPLKKVLVVDKNTAAYLWLFFLIVGSVAFDLWREPSVSRREGETPHGGPSAFFPLPYLPLPPQHIAIPPALEGKLSFPSLPKDALILFPPPSKAAPSLPCTLLPARHPLRRTCHNADNTPLPSLHSSPFSREVIRGSGLSCVLERRVVRTRRSITKESLNINQYKSCSHNYLQRWIWKELCVAAAFHREISYTKF